MYGMLLQSVQHFIQILYGEKAWSDVLEHAGYRNVVFLTHACYNDDIMVQLATSCSEVLGDRSRDEFMYFFGKCFVQYFSHYGYAKMLKVAGRYFRDFLHGIDNLHETMRFSYPKMLSPSFYVSQEDARGCVLHYRSRRNGFSGYVKGQMVQYAKKFYNIDLDIEIVTENISEKGTHAVYRLNFDNPYHKPSQLMCNASRNKFQQVPGDFFFKVFPFSFVFNQSLVITHAGSVISRLFQRLRLVGFNLQDKFQLRRPQMEMTWENILSHQKVVFEMESHSAVKAGENAENAERRVLLKGQMRFMENLNGVAFLCTPLIGNPEELLDLGLHIHDLSMHDSSREMALLGYQHASRLERSIEMQLEKSAQISEALEKLDVERQRSEKLLYSMIPPKIADRLRSGQDPISTCESFESVSILFSYMERFTEMCSRLPPETLVRTINSIVNSLDDVVERNDVFKVETLGDAIYMVAGGVPDRKPKHAHNIAKVALELLEEVSRFDIPALPQGVTLRVGIHSGKVVAGVVGLRRPQYCLFGDTVNTASRMQTHGQAGRIHVSETFERELKGSQFTTVFRGNISMKGKGSLKTYWLVGEKKPMDKNGITLEKTASNIYKEYAEEKQPDILSSFHNEKNSSKPTLFRNRLPSIEITELHREDIQQAKNSAQSCPFSGMPLSVAPLNDVSLSATQDELCNLNLEEDTMRSRSMTWASQCTSTRQQSTDVIQQCTGTRRYNMQMSSTTSLPQLPQDECISVPSLGLKSIKSSNNINRAESFTNTVKFS